MEHNNSGYGRGCRCDLCRADHAECNRRWLQANAERVNAQRRDRHQSAPQAKRESDRRYYLEHGDRVRKYQQEYRQANPEKVAASKATYHVQHRDQIRAFAEQYYLDHREEILERVRRYNRSPAGKAADHRKRVRRIGAPGFATVAQITSRIEYYAGRCWLCGDSADTLDHVIPLARGGSHWPSNLRPACRPCNLRKHAKDWRSYVRGA